MPTTPQTSKVAGAVNSAINNNAASVALQEMAAEKATVTADHEKTEKVKSHFLRKNVELVLEKSDGTTVKTSVSRIKMKDSVFFSHCLLPKVTKAIFNNKGKIEELQKLASSDDVEESESKISNMTLQQVEAFSLFIKDAYEDVVEAMVRLSNLPKEEIEELELDQCLILGITIFNHNRDFFFQKVMHQLPQILTQKMS